MSVETPPVPSQAGVTDCMLFMTELLRRFLCALALTPEGDSHVDLSAVFHKTMFDPAADVQRGDWMRKLFREVILSGGGGGPPPKLKLAGITAPFPVPEGYSAAGWEDRAAKRARPAEGGPAEGGPTSSPQEGGAPPLQTPAEDEAMQT
jgi:hypothetical protein